MQPRNNAPRSLPLFSKSKRLFGFAFMGMLLRKRTCEFLSRIIHIAKSKRHRLVQFAALQAAGTIHVRVVGVNEAAFGAAEHAVFRVRRAEPAAAHFGINPQATERAEQAGHVKDDEPGSGHNFNHEWTPMNTKNSGTHQSGLILHP
jgi:hypothetical protein